MIESLLARSRPVGGYVIIILVVMIVATTLLINQWFFPARVWLPLADLTAFIISGTLQAGWISIIILVGFVIFFLGRLRPYEVGLEWSRVGVGLVYTLAIWLGLHAVLLIWTHLAGALLVFAADPLPLTSAFLGQIAGNALAEEIVYRGFLLVQCFFLLRGKFSAKKWQWAAAAILLCTAIFAFSHIPNRLMKDSYDSAGAVLQDQFGLFVGGTVFCLAYLRSQNLFFVVGIHALGNRPSALFAAPNEALPIGLVVYLLATVLLLFWPKLPLVKQTTDKSESALAFMHDPEA